MSDRSLTKKIQTIHYAKNHGRTSNNQMMEQMDELRTQETPMTPEQISEQRDAYAIGAARIANTRPDPDPDPMLATVLHVLVMANDAYLTGHPEWLEIVEDAKRALRVWADQKGIDWRLP